MNALKSTGPKSPAGKQRSSRNAIKWGLFSRHVVLTQQDALEWQDLAPRVRAILQPVGQTEELLADEVIANWFRLARCLKIDAGLFSAYSTYQGRACGIGTAFAQATQLDCFGKLSRYEQHLEKKLALSLQRFHSVRKARAASTPIVATPVRAAPEHDCHRSQFRRSLQCVADGWHLVIAKVTAIWRSTAAVKTENSFTSIKAPLTFGPEHGVNGHAAKAITVVMGAMSHDSEPHRKADRGAPGQTRASAVVRV